MSKKEQEPTKIQIVSKVEQVSMVIKQNNLVLFNVNGWNALLPREFAESFVQAQELVPKLEEYEAFNEYLLIEKNIPLDELRIEFEKFKENKK